MRDEAAGCVFCLVNHGLGLGMGSLTFAYGLLGSLFSYPREVLCLMGSTTFFYWVHVNHINT